MGGSSYRAGSSAIGFTIGLSIVVFLHMVLGEMAPKSIAISSPEKSMLVLARPFVGFVSLFRPLIAALNWMANVTVRLTGTTPATMPPSTAPPTSACSSDNRAPASRAGWASIRPTRNC